MTYLSSFLLLAVLSTCAYADTRGFAVVAPGTSLTSIVQVSVGGTLYSLSLHYAGLPYYSSSFNINLTDTSYHYVADGVSETFSRSFPSGRTKTYNDFFGRQNTTQSLVQLGWPFAEKQQWTRALGPNGVFDDDYISTVFFLGDAANTFFTNGKKSPKATGVTVAIINKDDVGYWSASADITGRHGEEARIEVEMDLPHNYHARSFYKLRPSVFDPIFFREKIYNDILQSIGCPHEETSFARVYVNTQGLGLYHLQEKTSHHDFIVTQFYGTVPEPAVLGTPYDCSTGADFSVNASIYAFQPPSGGNQTNVAALINALAELDITNDTAIAFFDQNWFSIDYFFRAVIMEYLAGSYDSYLFFTTNFVLYDDPTEGLPGTHKFYFIDQDFDQTFGVDLSLPYNTYGSAFTIQPYTVYVNKTWSLTDVDAPHRTMVDRLLSNEKLVQKFNATLMTIVQSVFNPIALGRRIDAVSARVRPDVEWDRGLGASRIRQTTSQSPQWTIADFDNGFDSEVGGNWGFKTFISERSNYVSGEFGFAFDDPPLDPPPPPATTGIRMTTGQVAPRVTTGSASTTHKPAKTTGNPSDVSSTSSGSGSSGSASSGSGSSGSTETTAVSGAVRMTSTSSFLIVAVMMSILVLSL